MIVDNFDTYGQFVFDTRTDTIHSVELLARPRNARKRIDLDTFFELVEDESLVQWFICQVKQGHQFQQLTGIHPHINADRRILESTTLVSMLGVHTEYDMTLEITQVQGLPAVERIKKLRECKAHHVRVALDDYTLDNNMYDIAEYEFAMIKLDRTMLIRAETDYQYAKRLKDLVALFPDTEFVVEGVENAHQVRMMESLGFHLFQGYYFHKAELLSDLTERYLLPKGVPRDKVPPATI